MVLGETLRIISSVSRLYCLFTLVQVRLLGQRRDQTTRDRSLDEFTALYISWNDKPRQVVERFSNILYRTCRVLYLSIYLSIESLHVTQPQGYFLSMKKNQILWSWIAGACPHQNHRSRPPGLDDFCQWRLVMSRIDGTDLGYERYHLPLLQIQIIARELVRHVNSIRQLGEFLVPSSSDSPPFIGSWFGGPLCRKYRFQTCS
jgi:hypothetical protein